MCLPHSLSVNARSRARFGLTDGYSRTLEEVGKQFKVTRERIRQIEAKALRKMRHPTRLRQLQGFLDGEGIDSFGMANWLRLSPNKQNPANRRGFLFGKRHKRPTLLFSKRLHAGAAAYQIAVAPHVIDAADCRPEFVIP